jgi:ketosteroid isomerase-like protein
MAEHPHIALVRRGYEAFSRGDMDTLRTLIAQDAVLHVPGDNPTSGQHKGIDAILAYYSQLFEMTNGTVRVELDLLTTDGTGHVIAAHRITADRGDKTWDQRVAQLLTIVGDKVVDQLVCDSDLDASDAFLS